MERKSRTRAKWLAFLLPWQLLAAVRRASQLPGTALQSSLAPPSVMPAGSAIPSFVLLSQALRDRLHSPEDHSHDPSLTPSG